MQDYIPFQPKRQNLRHKYMPTPSSQSNQKVINLHPASFIKNNSSQDVRQDTLLNNSQLNQVQVLRSINHTTPARQQPYIPYYSQKQQNQGFFYGELPSQEQESLLSAYTDMINQEQDLFYLFDSFHQLLNSLKQVQQQYGIKVDTNPFKTNQNGTSSKSDWLTVSSMGSQWTGMKNMKQVQEVTSSRGQPFEQLNISRIQPYDNARSNDGYSGSITQQTNASRMIDKLKREIGELTEEQKYNQSVRNVFGLAGVQVQLFTNEKLREALFLNSRKKLISVYQLQNKLYKSHIGFCQLSVNAGVVPEDGSAMSTEVLIHKMFFAKYHRKASGFYNIIFQLIQHIFQEYKANQIKIKINSSQSTFLKLYQELGFKLRSKQSIIGELVIISLALQKSQFNQNYKAPIKKAYL